MWTQTHAAVPKTCSPGQSRFRHRKETCSHVRGAFEAGELSQAALRSCRAGGGMCSSRCPWGTANPSQQMWPNIRLIRALNTELGAENPNPVLIGLLLSCSWKEVAAPGGPGSAHKPLPHPPFTHGMCYSAHTAVCRGESKTGTVHLNSCFLRHQKEAGEGERQNKTKRAKQCISRD